MLRTHVACGLAHAHASGLGDDGSGVVHRDVSPSNILLSRHGAVKLTDFGIAKVQRREEKTRTGAIKGKEQYFSPEQALGDPVDGRADLFSLGVVLHQLIAGVGPYDGPTNLATPMNMVRGNRTADLALAAPVAPVALRSLVHAMTESRRERRPGSAEEVLGALYALSASLVTRRTLAGIVRSVDGGERAGPLAVIHVTDAVSLPG